MFCIMRHPVHDYVLTMMTPFQIYVYDRSKDCLPLSLCPKVGFCLRVDRRSVRLIGIPGASVGVMLGRQNNVFWVDLVVSD